MASLGSDDLLAIDALSSIRSHPSRVTSQANMNADSPSKTRRRFSRRDVVVVTAILGLLLCLALPALQLGREEARRLQCSNNLLHVGLALANYEDVHGRFPAAYLADAQGHPKSSWRVSILPFVSCSSFYDLYAFDEPWNSPSNLGLARLNEGYFYRCPDDSRQEAIANYLAVTGVATAWPVSASICLQDFSNPSRSILVVESVNAAEHWMEPCDLQFVRLHLAIHAASWIGFSRCASGPKEAISSDHLNGANVLFADGSLEFLATDSSPESLEDMFVIRGGESKIPLGARKRLRFVPDPDSTEDQHAFKRFPYKIEAYTTNVADTPHVSTPRRGVRH